MHIFRYFGNERDILIKFLIIYEILKFLCTFFPTFIWFALLSNQQIKGAEIHYKHYKYVKANTWMQFTLRNSNFLKTHMCISPNYLKSFSTWNDCSYVDYCFVIYFINTSYTTISILIGLIGGCKHVNMPWLPFCILWFKFQK